MRCLKDSRWPKFLNLCILQYLNKFKFFIFILPKKYLLFLIILIKYFRFLYCYFNIELNEGNINVTVIIILIFGEPDLIFDSTLLGILKENVNVNEKYISLFIEIISFSLII